jgi:hypothetical protein
MGFAKQQFPDTVRISDFHACYNDTGKMHLPSVHLLQVQVRPALLFLHPDPASAARRDGSTVDGSRLPPASHRIYEAVEIMRF